jgi:hypothetical protein
VSELVGQDREIAIAPAGKEHVVAQGHGAA